MMHDGRCFRWIVSFAVLFGTTARATACEADDSRETRSWWAFENHGDKPGTGYVLVERNGRISAAHFFVFMPDSPENESGRFFQISDIKQDEKVLTGVIKALEKQDHKERSRIRIELLDGFDDGKRIRAEVTDPDRERSKQRPQKITFVLQGDQWERRK